MIAPIHVKISAASKTCYSSDRQKPEKARVGVRFLEQAEYDVEKVGGVLGQFPSACSGGFYDQIVCVFVKGNVSF